MPRLTPDHLAARRLGVGSSDIIAIAGLSPYEGHNAWSVWLDKRGLSEPRAATIEQEAGHLVEEHVIPPLYTLETGDRLGPSGLAIHREHRWMLASFDHHVVGRRRTVECKLVGVGMMRDWDDSADDGIPHYVRAQVAWQLACTGDDDEDVAALICGTRFRIFRVGRDDELEGMLRDVGGRWWTRHIVEGAEPDVDESAECRGWLETKYPTPKEPVIDAMPDAVAELARAYLVAHGEMTTATETKARLANELCALLGDREGFEGQSYKVTWLANKTGKRVLRVRGKEER